MSVTLADHLRALPDEDLAALVTLRPDLVVPVPADMSALAARAQSRLSVTRALDTLDRFTLEILDAVRLSRGASGSAELDAVLGLAGADGPAAVERLRKTCLVYGPDHALHVVASVDDACSPYPAGLGRRAVDLDLAAADLVGDPAGLRRTLLAAPPAARAVLDRLAEGPPIASVSPTALTGDGIDSPV